MRFISLSLLKVLSFVATLTGAVRARSQTVFANVKICFISSHFSNILTVVESELIAILLKISNSVWSASVYFHFARELLGINNNYLTK